MSLDTNTAQVQRFDFSRISPNIKRTPQGFLRIPAYLTRTGIFEYVKADGSVVREFRPAEEVFKEHSLSTFAGAPITDMHPESDGQPVAIDPSNVKKYQVGFVGESIKQDGEYMAATLTVTDQSMISAIERGDRKEISNGYACTIENTPGEYNGQRYDCVQRNIIGNHVAIGPNDWGRAGPGAALRLDAKGAYLKTTHEIGAAMESQNIPLQIDNQEDVKEPTPQIEIAQDVIVPQMDEKLAQLQAKLDAATLELEAEKKARVDAVALAQLINEARPLLGEDYDFAGMDGMDIKKSVIEKTFPGMSLDGKSDEYIMGAFDAVMMDRPMSTQPVDEAVQDSASSAQSSDKTDGLAMANAAAVQSSFATKQDAKAIMMDWKRNAWKEHLAYNKNTND